MSSQDIPGTAGAEDPRGRLLAGVTAAFWRRVWIVLFVLAPALAIGGLLVIRLDPDGPESATLSLGMLIVAAILMVFVRIAYSNRLPREAAEVNAGYTTLQGRYRHLDQLDPKTGAVLRAADAPYPAARVEGGGGTLSRRARLVRAQALAPGDFVFRFSMGSVFRDTLAGLAPGIRLASPSGTGFLGSASASAAGLAIWEPAHASELARIGWSSIRQIDIAPTQVGNRMVDGSIVLHVTNADSTTVALPLVYPNSGFLFRRSSLADVTRIVARLEQLRADVASTRLI